MPSKSSSHGSSFSSGYGQTNSSTNQNQGGSSTNTSPFGNMLGWSGNYLNSQIQNPLNEYINMLNKGMNGGQLTGMGIPMAQAAIAQSRGAAAANLGSAENFLARSGGANSPFAGQLESSIAAQGNEATAQAPVGIYQELLGQIPGFLQGQTGNAFSAMGQAGALNNSNTWSQFLNQTSQTNTHNTNRQYSKDSGQSGGLFTF